MEYSEFVHALSNNTISFEFKYMSKWSDVSKDGWNDRLIFDVTPVPEGVESIQLCVERKELHPNLSEIMYMPSLAYALSIEYDNGDIDAAYSGIDEWDGVEGMCLAITEHDVHINRENDALLESFLERLKSTMMQWREEAKSEDVALMMEEDELSYNEACEKWELEHEINEY